VIFVPFQTAVLNARDQSPDPEAFGRIGRILAQGGVLVYPTETFYALGAAADSPAGVEKIYRLKERDRGKPLSIVAADLSMAKACADAPPPLFDSLAREFWPGPLTLIVKASPGFPPAMLGPGGSIAVRVPGLAWLQALLAHLGRPVTATSANISGETEISEGRDAVRRFTGKADLIVDGGDTRGGLPSTIVDLVASPPRIVRAGAVPPAALSPFLSK
jgi:L-threonylcarbamoyladenylate synthase